MLFIWFFCEAKKHQTANNISSCPLHETFAQKCFKLVSKSHRNDRNLKINRQSAPEYWNVKDVNQLIFILWPNHVTYCLICTHLKPVALQCPYIYTGNVLHFSNIYLKHPSSVWTSKKHLFFGHDITFSHVHLQTSAKRKSHWHGNVHCLASTFPWKLLLYHCEGR